MAEGKWRPVLTSTEIRILNSLLKKSYIDNLTKRPYHPDFPNDPERSYDAIHEDYCLQLMSKIGALAIKIEHKATKPAYTTRDTTPKEDVLLDLGGTIPLAEGELSPGAKRLAAYEKYKATPASCTAKELADATEHRYQNNLMSALEADNYDKKAWAELMQGDILGEDT